MKSTLRTPMRMMALILASTPLLADGNDITVDAGRGPVLIHVPDSYAAGTPAPLVVSLHAYGSSGTDHKKYIRFLTVHEEYGFFFAHPDGTNGGGGPRFWNATDACCDFGGTGVDDSGYLAALLDAIEAQLDVDPRRVYFVGHSNGGFMAHRMACDHSHRIAAIASLAGVVWKDPAQCAATEPVHALQIHGTADGTIQYNGGVLAAPYPGAVETAEHWATQAGCDLVPDATGGPLNLDKSIPGKESTVLRYNSNCDSRGSAELWSIQGGLHWPDLSLKFPRLVIEWLYAHPKPGIDYERYCSPGVPNSTGFSGVLDARGSDALKQDDFKLAATRLPVGEFGFFLASLDRGFVSQPGGSAGNLCVGKDVARLAKTAGSTDVNGVLSAKVSLKGMPTHPPQDVLTGQTWHFQGWYRDGATSNFTDGISILFP